MRFSRADLKTGLAIFGSKGFLLDREDNPLVVKDYFEIFHEVFIYIASDIL